jgi:excisionase family DNA binding protein
MTAMKPRSPQFDLRENTASSRQHAPRFAVDSLQLSTPALPKSSHQLEERQLLASSVSEMHDSLITRPLGAATEGERGDAETNAVLARATTQTNLRNAFEPLLDSEEAAKLLGNIHVKTLHRYARRGTLPGYRIGGHWFFRASELDSWLRSQLNSSCHSCRLRQEKTDAA